jgi:hypothetical protein
VGSLLKSMWIRLRESLLPMAKQFNQMASEAIDSLRRQRQMPAVDVERATPRTIQFVQTERGNQLAIEQTTDARSATLAQIVARSRESADRREPSHRRSGASPRSTAFTGGGE